MCDGSFVTEAMKVREGAEYGMYPPPSMFLQKCDTTGFRGWRLAKSVRGKELAQEVHGELPRLRWEEAGGQ